MELDYELASPYEDEFWERLIEDTSALMTEEVVAPLALTTNDVLLRWEGATVLRAYDDHGEIVATFTAENLPGVDLVNAARGVSLTYNGAVVNASYGGPSFRLAGVGEDDVLAAAGQ